MSHLCPSPAAQLASNPRPVPPAPLSWVISQVSPSSRPASSPCLLPPLGQPQTLCPWPARFRPLTHLRLIPDPPQPFESSRSASQVSLSSLPASASRPSQLPPHFLHASAPQSTCIAPTLACSPALPLPRPPARPSGHTHASLLARQHARTAYLFDNNYADTQLGHTQETPFDWSWLFWSTSVASSTSAASNLDQIPGGLEMASTAATRACGLAIGILKAMNSTRIPLNSVEFSCNCLAIKFLNP